MKSTVPGDDERVLVFLAELLPERDVGEDALVLLEVLLVADLASGSCGSAAAGGLRRLLAVGARRRATPAAAGVALAPVPVAASSASGSTSASITRRLRLGAQLAAQQPHGFEVRVDVLGAAADEAGDEHALERRDVHLRLDGRLDRDLVEAGAGRRARSAEQRRG